MKDPELARQFQDNLSVLGALDAATPIDAFHSYVIRALQVQGSLCFPFLSLPPKRYWISGESWHLMELVSAWRKQRVQLRNWCNRVLLRTLFQGWSSVLAVVVYRNRLNDEIQRMKCVFDHQLALADAFVNRIVASKTQHVKKDRNNFVAQTVGEAAQAELGQLRDKVPDKAVMAAAEAAGILPQFLAKEDTELFKSADKAQTERDYWRARSREGGCTIQGREYTAEQCNDFAAQKNDELSDLLPDVKARRREISREIKTLLELGKAAKAAKWVPGAKAPAAPAAPAGGKPQAKTDDPAPARQQPPELDYDKVSSTDDLARTILAEKRQRSKGR
jgi:hypothetical protein